MQQTDVSPCLTVNSIQNDRKGSIISNSEIIDNNNSRSGSLATIAPNGE